MKLIIHDLSNIEFQKLFPRYIKVPAGQGPKKDFGNGLNVLGENISKGNSGENLYITANFPKFLYRISGNFGWIQSAKKNGVKKKDLSRRM